VPSGSHEAANSGPTALRTLLGQNDLRQRVAGGHLGERVIRIDDACQPGLRIDGHLKQVQQVARAPGTSAALVQITPVWFEVLLTRLWAKLAPLLLVCAR